MTYDLLVLLDELVQVPGIVHAGAVLGEQQVVSAARRKERPVSDRAWLALSKTFESLGHTRTHPEVIRWVFGRLSILSFRMGPLVFGAVVHRDRAYELEVPLRDRLAIFIETHPQADRQA